MKMLKVLFVLLALMLSACGEDPCGQDIDDPDREACYSTYYCPGSGCNIQEH